jgi:hypothetical protein
MESYPSAAITQPTATQGVEFVFGRVVALLASVNSIDLA